jgi:hypothetical protein
MQFEIGLTPFYAKGDERRFFQGLSEIAAITEVRGVGHNLILQINVRSLNKVSLIELIAILRRYGISLAPLSVLALNKRFAWLKDERFNWYRNMFGEPEVVKGRRRS